MVNELEKWADSAMYPAAERPDQGEEAEVGFIRPRVTLLHMNADPLGSIAAACMLYEGSVVRSLADVSDDERREYFQQLMKTRLKAPFEFVGLHFLVENVTRSWTHQAVRQRTATFVQESLRFAVKEHVDEDVALPPSLRSLPADAPARVVWQQAVNKVDDAYSALVSSGIPAEDARGLLPHNIVTRLHWRTDLKALLEHAGNRLCTQAQFEWRAVFAEVAKAIRDYRPGGVYFGNAWQYALLADALRPVCYATGRCEFKANFDRSCSIRERVDMYEKRAVPSEQWARGYNLDHGNARDRSIAPIRPEEWLLDPDAAR